MKEFFKALGCFLDKIPNIKNNSTRVPFLPNIILRHQKLVNRKINHEFKS